MSAFEERPRIRKLRTELIAAIPRIPNNKASKQAMERRHLTDLLIDYVNWQSRFVAQRARAVSVELGALLDPRWSKQSPAIKQFLEKVEKGDDLTPYLSTLVLSDGAAPAAQQPNAPPEDRWLDKDLTLNTMGFHHFHLKPALGGPHQRTDELIFAEVTRDQFTVVAIFGHAVFEQNTTERHRLFTVHEERLSRGMEPSVVYAMPLIATSGHALGAVLYAQRCARRLKEMDAKFDDNSYVYGLLADASRPRPKRLKLD